ncbi:PTS glucose transporter subunit IIA [Niallia circulans]|uniref:PTS glucose transporter subunit IIA n=1 Tax=Niallia circulans TaxID=1397 RepID=A0A553STF4_NIACI|nr:PTS glucose transporter subunit IIA [Niallia circulans]TRZ40280.1 PTS glucose transporter subunit IIA [Niallia circulans]
MLFKRKSKSVELYAVGNGDLIDIKGVKDQVFSSKLMGEGFAVLPSDGNVFSPIEGDVVSIFNTKHAIGLRSKNGIEILVHMGLDTVELNGEGFELFISENEKVAAGQQIAKMDLDLIKSNGKQTDIIVVITNSSEIKELSIINLGDNVKNSQLVGQINL